MHRIVAEVPGLLSVVGGNITGYRAIAEGVTDRVCRRLRVTRGSSTQDPLPGAGSARTGIEYLDRIYGSRAPLVLALAETDPTLGASLAPGYPDIAAQVAFSVRHEWCERLEDFMLRRSYLGFAPDRARARLTPCRIGCSESCSGRKSGGDTKFEPTALASSATCCLCAPRNRHTTPTAAKRPAWPRWRGAYEAHHTAD